MTRKLAFKRTPPVKLQPLPRAATREEWLLRASMALRPAFAAAGYALPTPGVNYRVSCSFPGGGSPRKRIGEAWSTTCSRDGASEIFISPVVDDPLAVLATLVHELAHHAVGLACGHGGPFRRAMLALGLSGKPTATVAGPELTEYLKVVSVWLGPYPHGALSLRDRKRQTTRMLKVCCENCGFTVRTTQKWLSRLEAEGAFIECPFCNISMFEEVS